MPDIVKQIEHNLTAIRQRIAQAAAASGRSAADVALVAVTKYAPVEQARALAAAGCLDLGESRPQQLWQRAELLADVPVRWHLVGHLQRNKVGRTLPLVSLIHSVDSPRLLAAIDETAAELKIRAPVLLEVNISAEPAKSGLSPDDVSPLVDRLADYRHVDVKGLMCMAGLESGHDAARREFAALRELRDRLQPNCPAGTTLDELSMGMSGDFEAAIAEGATLVRIGSALFE
jgi:PLP dependent protein